MINILMHGCNGQIGQVISKIIKNHTNVSIVAGVDPNTSLSNPFPVYTSIDKCTTPFDVIIDFSTSKAVKSLLEYAVLKNSPVVVCTTGLSSEEIDFLHQCSTKIPIFFSANMSLGVNLLISLAKRATEILSDSAFDIEIIEKHHNQKIDAPSGTALAIADAINDSLDSTYSLRFDRSTVREKRPKKEIGIHAVRGGTIVGDHDILFAGNDEVITLSHSAASKEVFAVGALKAAKFIINKEPGLYTMQDLFE
ncbi:MAG: 4-hydroxy-tetrahydrodipicolinate reductase [Cellulosilyticaceae bacterium]